MSRIREPVKPSFYQTPPPPLTDLSSICRDSKIVKTAIGICMGYEKHPWLILGQIRLTPNNDSQNRGSWQLDAYLDNATDFEHDSAYALKLGLVGVELNMILYGFTHLTGWVSGQDPQDFRVPDPGYDPRKHHDATKCKDCKRGDKGHIIVPEGFYVPPENPKLWDLVKGRKVTIVTGPAKADSDG